MAKNDGAKQVRIWDVNLKKLADLNATFPARFSLSTLVNIVLRDGWPKDKPTPVKK